jgi:hypothetical protein
MSQLVSTLRILFPNVRVARPPIPHEHGAWAILFAPILIAFLAAPPAGWFASAAYAVSRGQVEGIGWRLWAACFLYFSSAVFFVKMLLAAVKMKGYFGWASLSNHLPHLKMVGLAETFYSVWFAVFFSASLVVHR